MLDADLHLDPRVFLVLAIVQVKEEMRFGTDDAPKARDAVVVQVISFLWRWLSARKMCVR